jgi:hypothetical protein
MQTNTKQIINLYKRLYKYGLYELKYTDKSYYNRYIRKAFESVETENKVKIDLLIKVFKILWLI